MLRKVGSILAVVIGLAILGYGWHRWQLVGTHLSIHQPSAVAVKLTAVQSMIVPQRLTTVGTLEAKQVANISADIAGKVVALYYQPGSYVVKGTPLIQLDNRTDLADLQSAQAALALTQVDYHRYLSLAKTGAQSVQKLDQARADYLQARATVSSDKTRLAKTTIRAPFSGYIGSRRVSTGDYVNAGQTLTVLVDRHLLQVNYQLPEKYLSQLHLGARVSLSVVNSVLPDHLVYEGKLTFIAPQVDDATHSVSLQADIPNPHNTLTPGLLVKVKQQVGQAKSALVVPQQCLVPTITGNTVFVVEHGRAHVVPVTVGIILNDKAEITDGLRKGQKVILSGQQFVKDGTKVKEIA